jgi:ketosteroid isomerase-like protein
MNAASDLITRLHDALHRRDLDAVMVLFHPQARFQDYLEGGEIEGPAAVRELYQRLFDVLSLDMDLIALKVLPGDRVQAHIQSSIRAASGRLWSDTRTVAIYQITDGLISSVEVGDPSP